MVSEQTKTEGRRGTVFSVLAVQKLEQEPLNERGVGVSIAPFFARSLTLAPFFILASKPHGNAASQATINQTENT